MLASSSFGALFAISHVPLLMATACNLEAFNKLTISNIEILSLEVSPLRNQSVGTVNTRVSASLGPGPATFDTCSILIQYTHPGENDTVNTYIGLPLDSESWNSQFLMNGGGGWVAGDKVMLLNPLAHGYATSTTNAGHNATTPAAEWGLTSDGKINTPALLDFASRALAEGAILGKLAARLYYGTSPKYSYWNGCSTGGRQGHMMSQKYPELFDGILAGCPAINWSRFQFASVWPFALSNWLSVTPPSCVLDAFTNAAIEYCDGLDGVIDGIIALPRNCQFDAKSLLNHTVDCTNPLGQITITEGMAELVNRIWEGPRAEDGSFQWYGVEKDANLTSILPTTCTKVDDCSASAFGISADWVQIFLAKNPSYPLSDMTRKEFDAFFAQSVREYTSIIGTDNPDLSKMKKAGTKMIGWHGIQDDLIPPEGTTQYYDRVLEGDSSASDYYRFFPAPGVAHCGGGVGFNPTDTVFLALKAWVENGTFPETIEAKGLAVGGMTSTRTVHLCAYPKALTYIGPDPNVASSFTCK